MQIAATIKNYYNQNKITRARIEGKNMCARFNTLKFIRRFLIIAEWERAKFCLFLFPSLHVRAFVNFYCVRF